MHQFILLLTLYIGPTPNVRVAEVGLTGEQCIAALIAHQGPEQASCEHDRGEPWETLSPDGVFYE
jgi:hypothetical protein